MTHHRHNSHSRHSSHRSHSSHSSSGGGGKVKIRVRRRRSLVSRLAFILPVLIAFVVCGVIAWLVFKPSFGAHAGKGRNQENQSTFTDRVTAFKILQLMEGNRTSEAITLAETIVDKLPYAEQSIANQIMKTPGDARARFESYICNWITIENSAATQSTVTKRVGFPSPSTPDNMVNFICEYADYRARSFRPPPREVNEELLGRIFLLSAAEKARRLGAAQIIAE